MIVGGAQENTLLSVRGQMEGGHKVVLLTGPTVGPEGRLLKTIEVPGLNVVEEPSLVRAISPGSDLLAYRRLKRYFTENRFDVVHTHSSKAGIIGRASAWAVSCPLVVHTVHGQAFHPYEKPWRNRLYIQGERFAARRCHHIFTVSQAMIEQCVAAGIAPRDKYSVVYSGMEMEAFLKAQPDPVLRNRLGIPEGVPVVGKIARLFELKGHEFLFQAAPAIVDQFPDVRFLLVGDGILREEFEKRIQDMGLTANFVFAGLIPPAEVPRYTALMDVLVHLSLREGLPRTVVQALASGKPAIGFELDGTPEVILDDQTGFLCPPENAERVAQATIELLRNPHKAKAMGQKGREMVAKRFDWHQMVEQLEAAYYRLLAR